LRKCGLAEKLAQLDAFNKQLKQQPSSTDTKVQHLSAFPGMDTDSLTVALKSFYQ
jgi:hypothetical protein